jgi:hypothetical protein
MKITQTGIHKDAVQFLKALTPDLRMALQLNKMYGDVETPKSGYKTIHTAFEGLVMKNLDFSLTEAIVILSNSYFHTYVETDTRRHEEQVSATRRHAAVAYGEAVRHTAQNIYAEMWRDWTHGKGTVDEILSRLND